MTDQPHILIPADLPPRKPTHFEITPNARQCAILATELGLETVSKLRLRGQIRAQGRADWLLEAELGASATQLCAITMVPVLTRIDVPLRRLYLAQMPEPEAAETEMSFDSEADLLPAEIDLMALIAEELDLALPQFPRAEGADLEAILPADAQAAPEPPKPFAGLAALRDKLAEEGKG